MHVFVTGASSGIGEAIAAEYGAQGAKLSLLARRKERLEDLASRIGAETFIQEVDLSDPALAAQVVARSEEALGPIDVLVNNAGVQIVAPTVSVDPEAGERLLRLNVATPFRLTLAVLPGMIARRRGAIVDIASLAALAPTPGMYYYNASKAALAAASESLRAEVKPHGVHVLTVYPGPVDTAMARSALNKYEGHGAAKNLPMGTTERLAVLIRRAVERRKARVVYPSIYTISRWMPAPVRWALDRFAPIPSA